MGKINAKTVSKIHSLRSKGLSIKRIARQLNISVGSVSKYSKSIILGKRAKGLLKENEKNNWIKFSAKYATEKEITVPHLNKDLANILGHLFFDGCVSITNGKYIIGYANASIETVNNFNTRMRDLFSIKPGKLQYFHGKNTGWFQTCIYSKKVVEFLQSYSPSYSTKQKVGVPAEIKNADKSIQASFLRAFWDDEGSISCDGRLSGSSKSEKMIEDLVLMHNLLGIDSKKQRGTQGKAHTIYIKRNFNNFLKFYKTIGFSRAIITKGGNLGKLKQEVLKETLLRMGNL